MTDEYVNSTLNTSISKQTHRFSKANRFGASNKRLQTQIKYNLPSMLDKKTCSFGIGNKNSLKQLNCSPPPGAYQSRSDFSKQIKGHTPSFSPGRRVINFGNYLNDIEKRAKKLPSPNRYDIKLPKSIVGGNMGLRLHTQSLSRNRYDLPGPGTYALQGTEMANSSLFFVSHLRKSTSPKYVNSKTIDYNQKRKSKRKWYDVSQSKFGNSRTSKYKNVSVPTFSKSKRQGLIDKSKINLPGFKYKMFSQFGNLNK